MLLSISQVVHRSSVPTAAQFQVKSPFKSKFTDFLGMDLWLTCFCLRKAKKHCHPCILVGPVIQGKPVEYFNRRVLWVPAADPYQVESGPYGAVRDGGGVIRDVQRIGRVAVPIEKHLSIVDNWVNDALGGSVDGLSGSVIEAVQKRLDEVSQPETSAVEGDTMELDVFSAMIVNRSEDEVFVYRKPSSFP